MVVKQEQVLAPDSISMTLMHLALLNVLVMVPAQGDDAKEMM